MNRIGIALNNLLDLTNLINPINLIDLSATSRGYLQSSNLIEVSKNLGLSSKQSFFKVILPSARPAIVVLKKNCQNGGPGQREAP